MTKLPPSQQRLFDTLNGQGDVSIDVLFAAVYPDAGGGTQRYKQQFLGPCTTRLNRSLVERKLVVKPGDLKGTYCLKTL